MDNKIIKMPMAYSELSEEMMEAIEGGKSINLPMSSSYLSRSACRTKAEWLLTYGYCNNMDVDDVAQEIFGHACAAVYGTALASVLPGYLGELVKDWASHGIDGIYLEDKKDSKAALFAACWYMPGLGLA